MNESMNPGSENSQVVNMVKALIQQSINNEAAVQENNKLILAQGVKLGALEEHSATLQSDVSQAKAHITSIDGNLRKVAQQSFLSPDHALSLQLALVSHAELFEKPLEKSVRHTHHIGKPFLILGGAYLLVVILVVCFILFWDSSRSYRENDIKWRYMKQSRVPVVLNGILAADSLYQANPDQFRIDVEFEEKRQERYNAKLWLKSQTEEEMRDIEGQEKKKK